MIIVALSLRVMLIVCAFLVLVFVIRKIKKSQMQAIDSIFWLLFSLCFVVFGVFPDIPITVSVWLGFASPSNFVFLFVIAVLVMRDFTSSIRLSKQEQRLNGLIQEIALRNADSDN